GRAPGSSAKYVASRAAPREGLGRPESAGGGCVFPTGPDCGREAALRLSGSITDAARPSLWFPNAADAVNLCAGVETGFAQSFVISCFAPLVQRYCFFC